MTHLATLINSEGEAVPAIPEQVPQHPEDCFGCAGDGYLTVVRPSGEFALIACDVHPFTPTSTDMAAEVDGIPVSWINDGDAAIALTADPNRARFALHQYLRDEFPDQSAGRDVKTRWVVFHRAGSATAHLHEYGWTFSPASPGAEHAVQIVQVDLATAVLP